MVDRGTEVPDISLDDRPNELIGTLEWDVVDTDEGDGADG